MIPAIQRGCMAAKTGLFKAPNIRTVSYAPFSPPSKMPLWTRRATFIPSHLHVPICIGGNWSAVPKRGFGNEEDAGVPFHREEKVKTHEISIKTVSGADWREKADLLIALRKEKYHVIEFPKGVLDGEAAWVEEMMRTVSQGKKLNFYARFGNGSGESVHENPDAGKMKELEVHADGRDLVVHSLDLSKEAGIKAAAQLLEAISGRCVIRMTFY